MSKNPVKPGQRVPIRHNGFNRPFNSYQIIAWVFMICIFFAFVIFYQNMIPISFYWISMIIFIFFYSLTWILNIVCTAIDPSDINTDRSKDSMIWPHLAPGKRIITENNWCQLCRARVGVGSKHCRKCNKCTGRFDHHCDWLNNCIGLANYVPFFFFLTVTFISVLALVILGGILVVFYFFEDSSVHHQTELHSNSIVYVIGTGITVLVNTPVTFFVGELLVFHIRLVLMDMTTFDYITREKAKYVESTRIDEAKKSYCNSCCCACICCCCRKDETQAKPPSFLAKHINKNSTKLNSSTPKEEKPVDPSNNVELLMDENETAELTTNLQIVDSPDSMRTKNELLVLKDDEEHQSCQKEESENKQEPLTDIIKLLGEVQSSDDESGISDIDTDVGSIQDDIRGLNSI
eukprot:TRINITY_DN2635_c0_g2_i1.p1 TRINITY_DN2635_c0_g2~~TRINITY_DN2635_c0_g2_i1.p1  ORF type:complete len:406 (+),score=83.57 TRINITY_DN2635_c0_g2_i1:40-1257(+)